MIHCYRLTVCCFRRNSRGGALLHSTVSAQRLASRKQLSFSFSIPARTLGFSTPRNKLKFGCRFYAKSTVRKQPPLTHPAPPQAPNRSNTYRWQDHREHQIIGGFLVFLVLLILVFFHDFAPETGRFRIIAMPKWLEKQLAELAARGALSQERLLSPDDPRAKMARRVAARLYQKGSVAGSKIPKLTVHVIANDAPNAGVLPDGTTIINSGLFKIISNEDELAVVLAHEVAHVSARHAAEKLSLMTLVTMSVSLLFGADPDVIRTTYTLLLGLPFSRKMESEADYIGLLLMSRACYDPTKALGVWTKFQELERQSGRVPRFLSTHPSPKDRFDNIKQWLPKAEKEREDTCPAGLHPPKKKAPKKSSSSSTQIPIR